MGSANETGICPVVGWVWRGEGGLVSGLFHYPRQRVGRLPVVYELHDMIISSCRWQTRRERKKNHNFTLNNHIGYKTIYV